MFQQLESHYIMRHWRKFGRLFGVTGVTAGCPLLYHMFMRSWPHMASAGCFLFGLIKHCLVVGDCSQFSQTLPPNCVGKSLYQAPAFLFISLAFRFGHLLQNCITNYTKRFSPSKQSFKMDLFLISFYQ